MIQALQLATVTAMRATARLPGKLRRPIHRVLQAVYQRCPEPYRFPLHGRWMWFNARSAYPVTLATYRMVNGVLVDSVAAAYQALGRKVTMIDVGAAIGDTLMLIEERCPGMVAQHFCVEAAPSFLELLKRNTADMPHVTLIPRLLAAEEKEIPSLVHTHQSTAAAVGEGRVEALPLDRVPELAGQTIDVLKVDVDGYDGEVLAGAKQTLLRDKPVVIFEWHPVLWKRAGKDSLEAFKVLREAGYHRMAWFRNTGEFSHFTRNEDADDSLFLLAAQYLEMENSDGDPHFDVVALHESSPVDVLKLASLAETKKWRGW